MTNSTENTKLSNDIKGIMVMISEVQREISVNPSNITGKQIIKAVKDLENIREELEVMSTKVAVMREKF